MASRLPLIIICALFSGAAGAAELGNSRVNSFIGQQLVADIELDTLDAPATPVQVRLAHPNVYRGANIAMPHVLSTLSMTVTQRDGRQFLHLTSTAPVEASHLHVYLELFDGGQRNVRLATLSMAPNPSPPPAPVPLPALAPVSMPVNGPVNVPTPAPNKPPAPLAAKAPPAALPVARPAAPRPRPAPPPKPVVAAVAAVADTEESAPVSKEAAKPAPKEVPRPAPKPAPAAPPLPMALAAAPPLPLAPAAAAPAACAPSGVDQSTVCAALDYKNTQLRAQIDALEGRVKVLQVALGANPAEVSQPTPADRTKPHPARRRPAPEPEASIPWGAIAAGFGALLALAGAALLLLRRRRRAGRSEAGARQPLMLRLRQRFARSRPAPKAVEPKLGDPRASATESV